MCVLTYGLVLKLKDVLCSGALLREWNQIITDVGIEAGTEHDSITLISPTVSDLFIGPLVNPTKKQK